MTHETVREWEAKLAPVPSETLHKQRRIKTELHTAIFAASFVVGVAEGQHWMRPRAVPPGMPTEAV